MVNWTFESGKEFDGDDTVLKSGIATIVCCNNMKRVLVLSDTESKPLSLNDCLKIIEFNLKDNSNDIVTVLFETIYDGTIYRYNQYSERKWVMVGKTVGLN